MWRRKGRAERATGRPPRGFCVPHLVVRADAGAAHEQRAVVAVHAVTVLELDADAFFAEHVVHVDGLEAAAVAGVRVGLAAPPHLAASRARRPRLLLPRQRVLDPRLVQVQHVGVQLVLPPVEHAAGAHQVVEQLLHVNVAAHAAKIQTTLFPTLPELATFATRGQLLALTTRADQPVGHVLLFTVAKLVDRVARFAPPVIVLLVRQIAVIRRQRLVTPCPFAFLGQRGQVRVVIVTSEPNVCLRIRKRSGRVRTTLPILVRAARGRVLRPIPFAHGFLSTLV